MDNMTMGGKAQTDKNWRNRGGASGGIYGLAFLGAVIYYFQQAATFSAYIVGFLKALVWPAILIYKILEYLKM